VVVVARLVHSFLFFSFLFFLRSLVILVFFLCFGNEQTNKQTCLQEVKNNLVFLATKENEQGSKGRGTKPQKNK